VTLDFGSLFILYRHLLVLSRQKAGLYSQNKPLLLDQDNSTIPKTHNRTPNLT